MMLGVERMGNGGEKERIANEEEKRVMWIGCLE
jgi:hypothetical protein